MSAGTSPPCCSTSARAMPTRLRDFIAEESGRAGSCGSSSSGSAAASAAGVGIRAKSAGVTWLTRASVHCADRIVATSSSNGVAKVQLGRGVRMLRLEAIERSPGGVTSSALGRRRDASGRASRSGVRVEAGARPAGLVQRTLGPARRASARSALPGPRASVPAARRSRPGTTLKGSAMRATTGARTVCDASALLDVALRQRPHVAERQREIERRVRDRAEVRVLAPGAAPGPPARPARW